MKFGNLGQGSTSFFPGLRRNASTWADTAGNLWLFGGQYAHYTSDTTYMKIVGLNTLWRYNILKKEWAWFSGSIDTVLQTGDYGSKGVYSATNVPPTMEDALFWRDTNGPGVWMYGGLQHAKYISATVQFKKNDLWYFDPYKTSSNGISKKDISVKDLKVYPNPARDKLIIELTAQPSQGMLQLSLQNSLGQVVKIVSIDSKLMVVELGNISKGIYFYQVEWEGGILGGGKIIVE